MHKIRSKNNFVKLFKRAQVPYKLYDFGAPTVGTKIYVVVEWPTTLVLLTVPDLALKFHLLGNCSPAQVVSGQCALTVEEDQRWKGVPGSQLRVPVQDAHACCHLNSLSVSLAVTCRSLYQVQVLWKLNTMVSLSKSYHLAGQRFMFQGCKEMLQGQKSRRSRDAHWRALPKTERGRSRK